MPSTGMSSDPTHSCGPGSPIQVTMSALPRIHIANGGIDITASSCSSLTRADRSYRWNACTYRSIRPGSGGGPEAGPTSAIVARARCSALFTAGTEVPSVTAASAAGIFSTSHRISAARCRPGKYWSAATNASRMLSLETAISAGSPDSTCESAIGDTQISSGRASPSSDSTGGEAGPRSIGSARRCLPRSMSRQMLVAIRYSQERTLDRPSKPSAARQARSSVSCTASSASKPEPSIR
jgi:hypothetical protein